MTATATKSKPAADAPAATGIALEELYSMTANSSELYRDAVIAAAKSGKAPSARELLLIVSGAERSLDQFMSDVERVQQRLSAMKAIADADARKPEADALQGVYLEKLATLNEVRAECEKRIRAAEEAASAAKHDAFIVSDSIEGQRRQAFDVLNSTADTAIREEVAAAEQAIERLKELRNDPESESRFALRFSEARRNASGTRDEIELELNPLRSQIIAELDEEIAAAERRLAETHRERLRPERFRLT